MDGYFNWTGGNLNTNNVLSTVTLQGGGSMTGAAGSPSSFSTIVVAANTFTMSASSRTFNGSAGITIETAGNLIWNAPGTFVNNGTGYVSNGGLFYVNPGNAETCTCGLPIVNDANGSILQVGSETLLGATLNVTGTRSGANVNQTAGLIIVWGEATLQVSSVLAVSGGDLDTFSAATAFIVGNVSVESDAQIFLNKGNDATGALEITGSLTMTGGTFNVKIDPFDNEYDYIETTGNITLGGNAVLSVVTLNPDNQRVPNGFAADILTTTNPGSMINGDFGTFLGLPFNDGSGNSWGHRKSLNNDQYQLFSPGG